MATTPANARYAGMRQPGKSRGLLEVFTQGHLLKLLVRKDVQIRYRGSVMGWAWSYVKPLSQFLVYYLILGHVLKFGQSIPNYAIYMFSGLMFVNMFNEALGNATKSIIANGSLVKKVYLPREMFPLSSVLIAFVTFLPQLAIIVVISLFFGWRPSVTDLSALILAIVITMVMALGLGLFFGAINVGLRDAQALVDVILMFTFWLSPVVYQVSAIENAFPHWLFQLYELNPITAAVRLSHFAIWAPTVSDSGSVTAAMGTGVFRYGLLSLAIALAMVLIGQLVFRKLEKNFAQDI